MTTKFTPEFIEKQKSLLKWRMSPSKGNWIEINGNLLVGCGDMDEETNLWNCAPLLTVEYADDSETIKNCVLYYPDALDEIERLQAKIAEFEIQIIPINNLWDKLDYIEKINNSLRSSIKELEEQQQWIHVSERFPEIPEFSTEQHQAGLNKFIVKTKYGVDVDIWISKGKHSYWANYGDIVTHWTLLPKPPEEES